MRITYKTSDGQFEISNEVESTKQAGLFAASVQEVFENRTCKKCGSTAVFAHRPVATKGNKNYDYVELRCTNNDCRAKLAFGTKDDGKETMFPKRKDKDDKDQEYWLPDDGWVIWDNKKNVYK